MELIISIKGHVYTIADKKNRTLYTVKKRGFGVGRYVLLDASKYHLYSMNMQGDDKKPSFSISHNEKLLMRLSCKSLFLDPTIIVDGKDTSNTPVNIAVASKDHRNFELMKDEENVGSLKVNITPAGELQYSMTINDKIFDDYFPFFAVAVDLTFGDMNRNVI